MIFSNITAGLSGDPSEHTHISQTASAQLEQLAVLLAAQQTQGLSRHQEQAPLSCPKYNTREQNQEASQGLKILKLNQDLPTSEPGSRTQGAGSAPSRSLHAE